MNRSKFMEVSERLTGFNKIDLAGAGTVETYQKLLEAIVPASVLSTLVDTIDRTHGDDAALASTVMEDVDLAPVAKNIIVLWYSGKWYQLPNSWRTVHGAHASDTTHVVSANAYLTGLIWKVVDAHPPGGAMQGFGAWSLPPKEYTL